MGSTVAAQTRIFDLENSRVKQFLDEVTYTLESESMVSQYNIPMPMQRDVPNPVELSFPDDVESDSIVLTISENPDYSYSTTMTLPVSDGEAVVYNLIPQRYYYYKMVANKQEVKRGYFQTIGRVRMIYTPTTYNIRDIGGWETADGRQVRYGKIYRGCELNGMNMTDSADIATLKQLGIAAELDMRYTGEHDEVDAAGVSAFGFQSSKITEENTYLCTENSGAYAEHMNSSSWLLRYKKEFQFIIDNLRLDRPVYQHCIWGADRTGMLSVLIEGVLGVTYDNIVKDYELTSFSSRAGDRFKTAHLDSIIKKINQFDGNTLQEKFRTFLTKKVGLTTSNLDYLIETMLEKKWTTVDIKEQQVKPAAKKAVYDLQGRKATERRSKGIYIEVDEKGNSRKFIEP